jgi:outer membrane receptor protein involved in Fe transport
MSFNAKPKSARLRSYLTGASLGVISSLCLGMAASAQITPAPTPAPAEKPKATTPQTTTPATNPPAQGTTDAGTVTVVGEKPAVQSKIDRDVYDVTKDPDAATSSAAEILNKVPSVNVDPDGNVTLQGQGGVQVQLNGRSTPQLEGDSRAATLQSLNADDIESIEVISNPSAAFSGGGPIINIVLKKNRRLGTTGGAQVAVGASGRYNMGYNVGSTGTKWTFNGGFNIRRDTRKQTSLNDREYVNQVAGTSSFSNTNGVSKNRNTNYNLRGGVEYNPTENDTLGINLRYSNRPSDGYGAERYINTNSSGALTSDYVQLSNSESEGNELNLSANYEHRGKVIGEAFKVDYRHNSSNNENDRASTRYYAFPTGPNRMDHTVGKNEQISDLLGISYVRPFEDQSKIALGLDYEYRQETVDNRRSTIDPLTGVETVNAVYSNLFEVDTLLTSAYVTYERYFSRKFGALFGLRIEGTQFDLFSVSQSIKAQNSYTRLVPSLTLNYKIDDKSKVRFSYSLRNESPRSSELNPFITYRDPQNVSSGNAQLKPQKIASYEVRYDRTASQKFNYNASLNYRQWTDTLEFVSYYIPNPACPVSTTPCDQVLLSTRDNLGESTRVGANVYISYRPNTQWNFNISPSVSYTERTNRNSLLAGQTSGSSQSLTSNVDYRLDNKNRFGLNYNLQGKSIDAQGTTSGTSRLNLNYARTLTPKLQLSVRVDDALNGQKSERTTNTLTGKSYTLRAPEGQLVYVSLRYLIGDIRAARQGQGRNFGGGNRGGGDGSSGGMGSGGQTNPGGMY